MSPSRNSNAWLALLSARAVGIDLAAGMFTTTQADIELRCIHRRLANASLVSVTEPGPFDTLQPLHAWEEACIRYGTFDEQKLLNVRHSDQGLFRNQLPAWLQRYFDLRESLNPDVARGTGLDPVEHRTSDDIDIYREDMWSRLGEVTAS